ncbi:LacI family DNA-binding transcriptional regulator, partial [Bacillus sp. S34]|nr:LacI family DNA-binding transcriptional regulator [Bacillus sp. S34]
MTTTTALGDAGGKRRKAPTIFDVAERAGVSHQTVSRVINGDPTVREQFRIAEGVKDGKQLEINIMTANGYSDWLRAAQLAGVSTGLAGLELLRSDGVRVRQVGDVHVVADARAVGRVVVVTVDPRRPSGQQRVEHERPAVRVRVHEPGEHEARAAVDRGDVGRDVEVGADGDDAPVRDEHV